MTASPSTTYYDRYWERRCDASPSAARSRDRARLALSLLGPERGRLLEVGCGPGWALEVFKEAGFEVLGVDISETAVDRARSRGLEARVCDLESEKLSGRYDVLAMLEVLEHVARPAELVRRILPLLAPSGRILVSLPNEWHLLRRLTAVFGRPGFGGHDDPHLRHFDVRSARRFLDSCELERLGSRWDGLAPPRWGVVKSVCDRLAQWVPGLFAISGVHLLQTAPREPIEAGEGRRSVDR